MFGVEFTNDPFMNDVMNYMAMEENFKEIEERQKQRNAESRMLFGTFVEDDDEDY